MKNRAGSAVNRAGLLVLAVVASAVMIVLAMPPADVGPLGFVFIVPVMLAVQGRGFALGFASGMGVLVLGAFLTRMGWFYRPSILDGDPGWNYAGFALFGLVVGFTCAFAGEMKRTDKWTPWVLAALAVLLEAALLLYLPAHLGLTQYRAYPAMKIASFGGVWAVSYMVWSVNFLIVRGIATHSRKLVAACAVFVGLFWGVSAFTGEPQHGSFKVAAVQTEALDIEKLTELTLGASFQDAMIVVWPELSSELIARAGETEQLKQLGQENWSAPFVTSFEDDATPLPYNVAAVFGDDGESERYKKRKPFGAESKIHAAGTEAVAVKVEDVTYGLNICFDSCFPYVMRETAKLPGVEVILLPTLDPRAPFGSVQAMHAAYTPFRAAELGLPIVRADTTAYSMVVDSRGVIVAEAGSGTEEVLVAGIVPGKRWTFYRIAGDWFLYLCGVLVVVGSVLGRKAKRPAPSE